MPRSSGPGGPDLFAAAAEEQLAQQAPLAARLRPHRLDDIVGQDELVGKDRPLRVLVEADRLSSAIFWGPPGTGKTTLAQVIARHTAKAFEPLSAVSASVKDVREVVARAEQRLGERGQGTILFLDEVHRFNKAQQDALLPSVESGLLVLIGATTENPYFEVNPPLLSRSTLFRLQPLGPEAVRQLLDKGLDAEGAEADEEALIHLAERAGGDGPHARGGRGRPVHRPAAGDPGERGHRRGRSVGPRGRHGGCACRRVRRAAGGAAQPGPSGRAPRDRTQVEPGGGRHLARSRRRPQRRRRRGPDAPARRPLPVGGLARARRGV